MTVDLDNFNSSAFSRLLELRDEAMNRTEEEIESGNYVPVFILDAIYFIPEECVDEYTNNLRNL